ncbi:MAG: prolyl oligopeptidase family serine peptidase [Alphaproteobacteria bacterium]|nr:prolyl oligopeptidase family serine peptidase [Alphaproteobacteria bacterium]MBU1552240.1 prolyl oligopeptidase family serine peptidase [Alphaproteobacteria bacterium]MBU2336852.1 prolyl oligopeptidase family serine peptidase [Alphaproteobacteria bacterium]MBU2389608.1 prolyl oligopeptidase family serine peptidase [Alphaproteobacteria bacterium]
MKLTRRSFLALLSLVGPSLDARAQPNIPEVTLDILKEQVPTHRLDVSDLVLANGRSFRIFRALPTKAPTPAGYPALYMLDGNGAFDVLTAELLAQVPGLAVFGIGYPTELRFAVEQRSLDYTPSLAGFGPGPDPQRPDRQVGGAADFLAILRDELRLSVEAGVLVDSSRRFLWGHSYGGLFALYVLLNQPSAFAGYAAISPSVWWGEKALQQLEEKRGAASAPARVLIALGDREQRSSDKTPLRIGPAPATMELVERLRRHEDLSITATVLDGLGHGQTFAASIPLVLDWISAAE